MYSCPNIQYGRTALNRAAHVGHLDVVSVLLDRGADVNTAATVRLPADPSSVLPSLLDTDTDAGAQRLLSVNAVFARFGYN